MNDIENIDTATPITKTLEQVYSRFYTRPNSPFNFDPYMSYPPAGACLEVASQVGIPDDFMLVIEHDRLNQPCHVIWRTATRLGVEFSAA